MTYFFSSYPLSAGVPLTPLLWQLFLTTVSRSFLTTVSATATAAKKIGQIHKVAVFNSSLLLLAVACGMVAQQQGRRSL